MVQMVSGDSHVYKSTDEVVQEDTAVHYHTRLSKQHRGIDNIYDLTFNRHTHTFYTGH